MSDHTATAEPRSAGDAGVLPPSVRTVDVWKTFPQEPDPIHAVQGISLTVERGEFTTREKARPLLYASITGNPNPSPRDG